MTRRNAGFRRESGTTRRVPLHGACRSSAGRAGAREAGQAHRRVGTGNYAGPGRAHDRAEARRVARAAGDGGQPAGQQRRDSGGSRRQGAARRLHASACHAIARRARGVVGEASVRRHQCVRAGGSRGDRASGAGGHGYDAGLVAGGSDRHRQGESRRHELRVGRRGQRFASRHGAAQVRHHHPARARAGGEQRRGAR